MESISILRDTRQKLQEELKKMTVQLSNNITAQLGVEPFSLILPKLKDTSRASALPAPRLQKNEAVVQDVSEHKNLEKAPSASKLKLVKSFSSGNELRDLLMTMVNEQVEVKTSSGDVSGTLVTVERDFIQVGYTVLIPLERVEVVTQMSGVDSK